MSFMGLSDIIRSNLALVVDVSTTLLWHRFQRVWLGRSMTKVLALFSTFVTG